MRGLLRGVIFCGAEVVVSGSTAGTCEAFLAGSAAATCEALLAGSTAAACEALAWGAAAASASSSSDVSQSSIAVFALVVGVCLSAGCFVMSAGCFVTWMSDHSSGSRIPGMIWCPFPVDRRACLAEWRPCRAGTVDKNAWPPCSSSYSTAVTC